MRKLTVIAAVVMLAFLTGCGTTKTVNIHTDKPMVTGEQMSCVYHGGNLYCGSPLVTGEDIDKRQLMTQVVSLISHETKYPDMKQSGSFSTKFHTSPKEYSFWNCSNTGVADPAVRCLLLREADAKLVAQQEQEITLNDAQEFKLQYHTPEQSIIAACGAPIERKKDIISYTLVYPSTKNGVLVEVRFSTIRHDEPPPLDELTTVDAKTRQYYVGGIHWSNFKNIGKSDEDAVPPIREYFPCILK